MSLRTSVDTRDVLAELDRLADMGHATYQCERVLAQQYAIGQASTHVITGSLRGSEDVDSDFAGGRWQGRISWGGPSPGNVNNPVDYAVYESARGGHHDFRQPLLRMSGDYLAAVKRHVKGGA